VRLLWDNSTTKGSNITSDQTQKLPFACDIFNRKENDYLYNMLAPKLLVVLLLVAVALTIPALAQTVFHPASQVSPGVFGSDLGDAGIGNFTFNSSLLIIDNLGIGTIAPADKLVVNGSFRVDNATGDSVLFANATSGNVGIGTATPEQKLDVAGYVKGQSGLCIGADCRSSWSAGTVTSVGSGTGLTGGTITTTGTLSLNINSGSSQVCSSTNKVSGLSSTGIITCSADVDTNSGGTVTGSGSGNYLAKWTGGTSLGNSIIYDNGNVGIGATSLFNLLHLRKGTNLNLVLGNLNAQTGATAMTIVAINDAQNDNIPLEFHGSKFYFHSGNVGIGTTTPGRKLSVLGDGISISSAGDNYYRMTASGDNSRLNIGYWTTDWSPTAGSPAVTLTYDGKVGIGTTSPTGVFQVANPAVQTIASGNTITANACGTVKMIHASGAVTTDTTNTFTAPTAAMSGCCMTVISDGAAITLDANANFKTIGGADVVLGQYDSIMVCSFTTTVGPYWIQTTPVAAAS
jgi:hypothetical protein